MAKNSNKKVVRNFLARNPLLSKGHAHVVTNKAMRAKGKVGLRRILKDEVIS